MANEAELKIGDRVINQIDEIGTLVEPTSDPFHFVSKSGMVAVHYDGTEEDEYFLSHPETLRKVEDA
jgi:hypothetical protein